MRSIRDEVKTGDFLEFGLQHFTFAFELCNKHIKYCKPVFFFYKKHDTYKVTIFGFCGNITT